jgi:alpha-tubulin suppressor-like RCC1 family protein
MANTFFQINGSDVTNYFVPRDVFSSGQLWGFGNNQYGQLGTNDQNNRSSPIQTVAGGANWKQVAQGSYHTGAIKTDGTLWMWGDNTTFGTIYGQLGTNNGTQYSSPVQTVSGGTNWKQVDCGDYYTAAIKTDGTLWTWGRNSFGQLGDNTVTRNSSPIQTVAGGTNWKQVCAGSSLTGAIKTDGTLWMWGTNSAGQLGTNDTTSRSSPVQTVSGGTNWKLLSCWSHSLAIKTDGTLWGWGSNANGELGTNNTTSYSSPVQTVSGGNNWKQVMMATVSTAAIKTDGTLWVWGSNVYGQLGTNDRTTYSSPVQTVAAGTNWKQIAGASGTYHVAAIKTDGTLWTWGYAQNGELGTNDQNARSSPVQTVAGGNNWKQVSCGYGSTFALNDIS